MKIRHFSGTVVNVADDKARLMVSGGSWVYASKRDQRAYREAEDAQAQEDTPETVEVIQEAPEAQEETSEPDEEVKAPATIPEMREWALKNDVPGVKAQGKLAKTVIDAYQEAHKE